MLLSTIYRLETFLRPRTHARVVCSPEGSRQGERDEMDCSQIEHRSPLSDLPVGGEQEQKYTETNAR